MAEFCGFAVDHQVPDESHFSFAANGLLYAVTVKSATGCRSAQRVCHTGGV